MKSKILFSVILLLYNTSKNIDHCLVEKVLIGILQYFSKESFLEVARQGIMDYGKPEILISLR